MDPSDLPIPNSYWVQPGQFLAGEYPGHSDVEATRRRLEALLAAGLNSFVDLTRAGELVPYQGLLIERARARRLEVSYTRIPVLDHSVPTLEVMKSILNGIDRALADGRNVYVHCWGGVGRTGTTTGCYLVRHGLTGQQALQQIAAWWLAVPKRAYFPRSPETEEQVEFIMNWNESNSSPG